MHRGAVWWAAASATRLGGSRASREWRIPSTVQLRRWFTSGENIKHCQDLVQKGDMESFLCLPFLPASARSAVVAVKAFNVEVARAADKSNNARAVEMRLHWWKAVLENIGRNQAPEHPVAMAVCEAVEVYDLDVQLLQSLVDHRIEELKVTQPATEKEVFQYAEGTQSAMLHLTLQAIGEYKSEGNKLAAKHVGIAMGICLLLRGTRHNAKRNKIWMPKNMSSHFKLSPGSVAKGEPTQALAACAYEMAMLAQEHLKLVLPAPAEEAEWSSGGLPALYPAAIARNFLSKLEERDYDLMHPGWMDPTQNLRLRLPFMLMKHRVLGKF